MVAFIVLAFVLLIAYCLDFVVQLQVHFRMENVQPLQVYAKTSPIGRGSDGTVILEGYLHTKKVAIKRILAENSDKAHKEISFLTAADNHPNVVQYYGVEETTKFVDVYLERCNFSLYDLVLAQTSQSGGTKTPIKGCGARIGPDSHNLGDFKLWNERGEPSPLLFQFMRDIVSGLTHLHALGIVHRDLKPHNVLISGGRFKQAKIADMGLSIQLEEGVTSFDTQLIQGASSNSRVWQAPEQLRGGRGSRAVDIFSLGCVFYYCVTKGQHPHVEQDGGKMDLSSISEFPEAKDLIQSMLNPNAARRPLIADVLGHPFFWDEERRLSFLSDSSDRLELDFKSFNSYLLSDLRTLELAVLSGSWDTKLDGCLRKHIQTHRQYNVRSVQDLLRVIRNTRSHFKELPRHLQSLYGFVPVGIDSYFTSRFPGLLIGMYHLSGLHFRGDKSFERYYPVAYTPMVVQYSSRSTGRWR